MNPNLKSSLIAIVQFIGILVLIFGGMALATWLIYIDEKLAKYVDGLLLMGLGVLVLIFGDKVVNLNEGKIGRLFFPADKSQFNSKMWKWVLGLFLMFAGTSLLFNRF